MGFFTRKKTNKKEFGAGKATGIYVIIGLGNPGDEYAATRHNMGYRALDILSESTGIEIRKSRFHSLIGQGRIGSSKVVLVKPLTFMNNSGRAAREVAMYFDVPSENVIVIYDDIDIPAGAIRIRKSGGPGTHNGMRSVVSELGTQEFPRIRIGVGAAKAGEDLIDRVIGKVPKEEQGVLDKAASDAALAAEDMVKLGTEIAMSRHNHK